VQSDNKVKTALEIVKIQTCKYYTVKQSQLIEINDNTIISLKFRANSFDIYFLIIVERMNRNDSINSS
jgi:hypothetical protein